MTSDRDLLSQISEFSAQLHELMNQREYRLLISRVDLVLTIINSFLDVSNDLLLTFAASIASFGTVAAYRLADFETSLYYAEKEIEYASQIDQVNYSLARGLSNRALAKHELGKFTDAEQDYLSALAILEKDISPLSTEWKPVVLSHLGQLQFTRKEIEKAQKNLSTFSLPQEASLMNFPDGSIEVIPLINKHMIALWEGEFEEAEKMLRQALTIAESRKLSPNTRGIIANDLGMVLWHLGQLDGAIEHVELACTIHRDDPGSQAALAIDLLNLGLLYERQENSEKALSCFKEAWDAIRKVAPHSVAAISILRQLGLYRLVKSDFKRARAALEKGMALYDEMRPRIAFTEEGQEGIFEEYRKLVETMMILPLRESWKDEVMLLIERAKARFWREQIDFIEDQRVLSTTNDGIIETAKSMFQRNQTSQRYLPPNLESVKNLENEHDYISSADKIKDLNGNNGLILNYFVGPNTTFLSAAFNRTIISDRIAITERKLFKLIDAFRNDLMGSSIRAQFSDNGKKLSELLLGKIGLEKLEIRHIVIMPDGPLWYLPFDALPLPTKVNADDYVYLFETSPVSYAPSATILEKLNRREDHDLTNETCHFLVVAQPEMSSDFSPIEGTLEEVTELKKLVGVKNITILKGNSATKANFLSSLTHATHIHIGSHALADLQNASPYIVFTDSHGKEDFLYTHEITTQRLAVDLVFLSACSTSIGKSSTGEGLMSTARAFLLAGCRCVVATLWPIDDNNAPSLISTFYRNLFSGSTVARALQLARSEFKNKQKGGNTDTWAAFQAIGYCDSLADRFSPKYIKM